MLALFIWIVNNVMTIIPLAFIFGGIYIYYLSFGWTLHIEPNIGFYTSTFLMLIGFILALNRNKPY